MNYKIDCGDTVEEGELFPGEIKLLKIPYKKVKATLTPGKGLDIGAGVNPFCVLTMETCHLEVPTHSIEEVISMETNFHALPSDFDSTNEISVFTFYGQDVG